MSFMIIIFSPESSIMKQPKPAQPQIKSIQLLSEFTFGNVILRKLTTEQCHFEKTDTSVLVMRNNVLYEIPINFCVIEYL